MRREGAWRRMETVYSERSRCVGCMACAEICPFSAVRMETDKKGFWYPEIDPERCRDCGLCQRVCQTYHDRDRRADSVKSCHTGRNVNPDTLRRSQSGGVFPALAERVLRDGGTVYACALEGLDRAVHVRIDETGDIPKAQKSKYIQSDLERVYPQVTTDLEAGRKVLFSGTPCQCDAVRLFLASKNVSADNLYLLDIICHGVPSARIWRDYLAYVRRKYGAGKEISGVIFRDKSKGWSAHYESFFIDGKKFTLPHFREIFYTNLCLRDCCYQCGYSNLNRCGDITVGDAWATDRSRQDYGDNAGLSLILVNSSKGAELFAQIRESLDCQEANLRDFMQPNLCHPSESRDSVAWFWRDYWRFGLRYVMFLFGDGRVNKICKILRRKILSLFPRETEGL